MIKRIFDIILSLCSLILLFPLLCVIAIKIRVELGRPIFFYQYRPGKNGKPFRMIKFRSMLDIKDKDGELIPDEKRLTKFGILLRSTSLDELPELWNVLKGEMSLVGPRPLLMEYLPLYSKEQYKRHLCKPGITGWSQINGRNLLTWDEKFKLDLWYIKNQSMLLDIKIIFKTFGKIIARENISSEGEVTVKKFIGNKK